MLKCTLTGLLICSLAGCGQEADTDRAAEDALLQAAMSDSPFITAGLQPRFANADETSLSADARVVGIVVNGDARAYPVAELSGMTSHVVNDQFGEIPVSVTYCDRSDCTRVFTSADTAAPLTLGTGGFAGDEMLVTLDGQMYPQSSGEIPLQDVPFEVTTWHEWKSQHPRSKVLLPTAESAAPMPDAGRTELQPQPNAEPRPDFTESDSETP